MSTTDVSLGSEIEPAPTDTSDDARATDHLEGDEIEVERVGGALHSSKGVTGYVISGVLDRAVGELATHYGIDKEKVMAKAVGLLKYVAEVDKNGGELRVRHRSGDIVRVRV